jgi:hypothetical protein
VAKLEEGDFKDPGKPTDNKPTWDLGDELTDDELEQARKFLDRHTNGHAEPDDDVPFDDPVPPIGEEPEPDEQPAAPQADPPRTDENDFRADPPKRKFPLVNFADIHVDTSRRN